MNFEDGSHQTTRAGSNMRAMIIIAVQFLIMLFAIWLADRVVSNAVQIVLASNKVIIERQTIIMDKLSGFDADRVANTINIRFDNLALRLSVIEERLKAMEERRAVNIK